MGEVKRPLKKFLCDKLCSLVSLLLYFCATLFVCAFCFFPLPALVSHQGVQLNSHFWTGTFTTEWNDPKVSQQQPWKELFEFSEYWKALFVKHLLNICSFSVADGAQCVVAFILSSFVVCMKCSCQLFTNVSQRGQGVKCFLTIQVIIMTIVCSSFMITLHLWSNLWPHLHIFFQMFSCLLS